MKILVYANTLEIGGSQTNAVDLAVQLAGRGHETVLFAPPGPLAERASRGGVTYEPAPERPRFRPSPMLMSALTGVVDRHGIEVVHGYEWPPILEACYGLSLRREVAVVGTIMSMGVAPFIPPHIPLVVGTANILAAEEPRRDKVYLLEPPVDLEFDDPAREDLALAHPGARAELGAAPDELLVVVVGRLAAELKREGLLTAIEAVRRLAQETSPLHLVIVGDGPARAEIEAAATAANTSAGRTVVTLVGERPDPRPWYAVADIALGMGGSALRAMAYGKPLVVQGEHGFWKTLTPDTLGEFLRQGWYGVGDGAEGAAVLMPLLRELVDPARRCELGAFARETVESRFSLTRVADLQERIYRDALESRPTRSQVLRSIRRPLAQVAVYEARRRYRRVTGRGATDDFNALSTQPSATTRRAMAGDRGRYA